MSESLRQAGVIPYRIRHGQVEVMLMTSRDTGRWVIPKGFIEEGETAVMTAVREAFEEAGVLGTVHSNFPLGFIPYMKMARNGVARAASIEVFALHVAKQKKRWPERGQREKIWIAIGAAAAMVNEPSLGVLFERLDDILDVSLAVYSK